jgi:GTP-binding protein
VAVQARLKQSNVTFSGSASSPAQFPDDGAPEVAFLGRSNVGKSSLLNALAGTRGLARVSSTPGRTRLVSFFRVESRRGGGDRLYLVDLPGYGYAKAPHAERAEWQRLVQSYLEGRDPLRLCVFIVDVRHEPMESDRLLRAYLEHHRLPYVVAANKVDKLGRAEARRRERALASELGPGAHGVVPVSALRGTGVAELWGIIRGAALATARGTRDSWTSR